MPKYHVEFDLDDSDELEEGETSTEKDVEDLLGCAIIENYAIELSNIKINQLKEKEKKNA